MSIELAKASLEGFNLTYQELNQQQETETRRIKIEAEIATQEAELEQEKLALLKEKKNCRPCSMLSTRMPDGGQENDKNLSAQRLEHLREKDSQSEPF